MSSCDSGKEIIIKQDIAALASDGQVRTAVHWFRKGLRFHDNPALQESIKLAQSFRCIYIIDPSTVKASSQVEFNKWRFLLESLHDLDCTLRKHNSRLYVLRGQPAFVLPNLFRDWHVNVLSIEVDPTPYGAQRDEAICTLAREHGVNVVMRSSHTLHAVHKLKELCVGRTPISMKQFVAILKAAGIPNYPLDIVPFELFTASCSMPDFSAEYSVPSLEDLGLGHDRSKGGVWRGGETEALRRLGYHLERRAWIASFDRPHLSAASLMASPNGLGPYLNFGCLSPRLLYWKIDELYRRFNGDVEPPISLHGQLILREFYYMISNTNANFDRVNNNPNCLPVPWCKADEAVIERIVESQTGFPWIDAIMQQLTSEGWVHSIAKLSLVSFITHSQLFYSWEEAGKLINTYALDGDYCTNYSACMMLSESDVKRKDLYSQESAVIAGKRLDPDGEFIRHYIPALRAFPSQFIYEPWTAPLDVQQTAGCVIGIDYPLPILDHSRSMTTNILRIEQFLGAYHKMPCISSGSNRIQPAKISQAAPKTMNPPTIKRRRN